MNDVTYTQLDITKSRMLIINFVIINLIKWTL